MKRQKTIFAWLSIIFAIFTVGLLFAQSPADLGESAHLFGTPFAIITAGFAIGAGLSRE